MTDFGAETCGRDRQGQRYRLDANNEDDLLQAAEEVLASIAQTNPQSGFVQRAIAAIRTWMRQNIPGFSGMKLSDQEIINRFIIPARRFVKQGSDAVTEGGMEPAFSRGSDLHETNATVNQQIEQWAKGKLKSSEILQLGMPSDISSMFNVPDLPIRLTQGMLGKARREHNLSAADLKDIALNVQTPIAVFKSTHGEGHIVLITEARHAEGNVTVAMQLNVVRDHIAINDIRTIYPRPDEEVPVWLDAGLLRGYEKRKGRDWLENSGGYNSRQPQNNATSDEPIVYDTDSLRNPSGNSDIRFSRSAAAPATGAPAGAATTPFKDKMDGMVDSLIYNFQDRFKPLKDIQKRAGVVHESMDAALAEERYSGMVRARTDDFVTDMREPLIKAIHDGKVSYDAVESYLHARHAPSRNAAMKEINPTEPELAQQTAALTATRDRLAKDATVQEFIAKRREIRDATADIEDGIADESLGRMLDAELRQLKQEQAVKDYTDAVEKLRVLKNVKPYTGDKTALSGLSNDESQAIFLPL